MVFLLLLIPALVRAQQVLPLNAAAAITAPLLGLPPSPHLSVSVAQCSSQPSSARFFLSNSTSGIVPGPGGGPDVFEISLGDGSGQWSGPAPGGGLLSVQGLDQDSFQIFVSDNDTTYQVLDQLPRLGDTTSNQAILFSHPFLPLPIAQPSFPNYTLPPANLSLPDIPATIPNLTLVVAPTAVQFSSLPQTACALLNISSTGSILGSEPWLRTDGWRMQWLMDGLSPSTNYTAYVIEDALKVSGPIHFATKSGKPHISLAYLLLTLFPLASFPCPLVYSLPYCPSTAYAAPLPPLPAPAFGYNASSLPDAITSPLLQYMSNFSTMLSTFACGRDLYSPLQTCADCYTHYRTWLCSISFPRCSEPSPGDNTSVVGNTVQVPLSALQPQPSGSPSRNPFFPNASYDYASLLPCLETCNAADRACPYFLGFKCPTTAFNAAASYGVGYIDSGEAGQIGNGATGVAQDRWGNVWCNET